MIGQGKMTHMMLIAENDQNRMKKVLHVFVSVKSDEIRTQNALENVAPPARREEAEYLKGRERDVKEKSHLRLRGFFPQ